MRTPSYRWRALAALGATLALTTYGLAPASATPSGSPGDEVITLDLNDSSAGGSYEQDFTRA